MDWSFMESALKELALNSPYAIIIIAVLIYSSHQNKTTILEIKSLFQTALQEIRTSHSESMAELRKLLKTNSDFVTAATKPEKKK